MLGTSGLGFFFCAWLLGRQGHERQGHVKNNNNNKNKKLKKAARITIASLFSRSAAQNGWRAILGSRDFDQNRKLRKKSHWHLELELRNLSKYYIT